MARPESPSDAAPRTGGLPYSDRPRYLGNPVTVTAILELLGRGTLIGLAQAGSKRAVQTVFNNLPGDFQSTADILLGGLPDDYRPMQGWNEPGKLDVWLKSQFPQIQECEPLHVVATVCEFYLKEILDFTASLPGGVKRNRWHPELDIITKKWVNILLGASA